MRHDANCALSGGYDHCLYLFYLQQPSPHPASCEPIHITVIGSATGIDLVIKILHRLGFAEASAWSKPQTDPNTGRPMRMLTTWLRY